MVNGFKSVRIWGTCKEKCAVHLKHCVIFPLVTDDVRKRKLLFLTFLIQELLHLWSLSLFHTLELTTSCKFCVSHFYYHFAVVSRNRTTRNWIFCMKNTKTKVWISLLPNHITVLPSFIMFPRARGSTPWLVLLVQGLRS